MKKTETIKIMGLLAAAYPSAKAITEAQVEIWHECLQDLEPQEALTAIRAHIMGSQFFPTVHEIREQIAQIRVPQLESGEAWGTVQKAIKHYGYYRELEAYGLMDDRTKEAVKAIGWQQICHTEQSSLGTLRAQFFKIYEGLAKRDHRQALLPEPLRNEIKQLTNKMSMEG